MVLPLGLEQLEQVYCAGLILVIEEGGAWVDRHLGVFLFLCLFYYFFLSFCMDGHIREELRYGRTYRTYSREIRSVLFFGGFFSVYFYFIFLPQIQTRQLKVHYILCLRLAYYVRCRGRRLPFAALGGSRQFRVSYFKFVDPWLRFGSPAPVPNSRVR